MKNYVISIKQNSARQAHIDQEFQDHGIEVRFFDAITPTTSQACYRALGLTGETSHCTDGELACLLSHVSLWQKCLDDKLDYMAIFEDDVILGKYAGKFLTQSDWLKANAIDFIKLEKNSRRARFTSIQATVYNTSHGIYKLHSRHIGAAGYIISARGAQHLLTFIQNLSSIEAIDILLFDVEKYPKAIPTYQILPAIVMQAKKLETTTNQALIQSDLRAYRGKEIKKPLSFQQKVVKEISRWFRPFTMKKITFE